MDIIDPSTGTKLFTHRELMARDSGIVQLHPGFADFLLALRIAFGQPMAVGSCCRTKTHNKDVGGHPRSLHIYDLPYHDIRGAMAIDIVIANGTDKGTLHALAWTDGWSVGVRDDILHLDRRVDIGMPQGYFTY